MILWLLDTNAVVAMLTGRSELLAARVQAETTGTVGISSIVAHELYFGAYRSQRVEFNLETLRLLFQDFAMLDFDREDARMTGLIRATLAREGRPIGPYDVQIAGQALARDLTLISNNVGEFQRINGLKLQDWTKA